MEKKKNDYPSWVLAHKTKGTEVRKFGQRYYLYKVSGFWDKEKKKSCKKTEEFLGRITEEGLIISKVHISKEKVSKISVVETGMSEYIHQENQDILQALNVCFPKEGNALFLLAMFRLAYQSPLKNMQFYYENSYISQVLPDINLSKNNLTFLLKEVGDQRENISDCMKKLMGNTEYVLIDQTHVISLSEQMTCNRLGYNSQRSFDPQVNLLFLFSPQHKIPLYYRMLAGDIRETKALKLTIEESGLQEAIVIGDKGFYSQDNVKNLSDEGLDYILPIPRTQKLCDYSYNKSGDKKLFDGFFAFEDRIIWYKQYQKDGHHLMLCLDNQLKEQEEKDYLLRIKQEKETIPNVAEADPKDNKKELNEPENKQTDKKEETKNNENTPEILPQKKGNTLEGFYEKQHSMGTITLDYSIKKDKSPIEIFNYFKSRNEIENTYDAYKNILEADRTYMQGRTQMETWSFINFLALIMYYRIYKQLLDKKVLNKYAPKDILLFLEHIKKLKINDKWIRAEITKKSQEIINLLRTN